MAHVTFNPNQPIQALSGNIGNVFFRTRNGQTYMFSKDDPVLPKNATRQQRAQFKRRQIIDQCVMILQEQISDLEKALAMRTTIRNRIVRLYNQFSKEIKARTKLQRAIMREYYAQYTENVSRMDRESLENGSVDSRE